MRYLVNFLAIIFFSSILFLVSCDQLSTRNATLTRESVNLSGKWSYALDSNDIGIEHNWYDSIFANHLILPGTLDGAEIGTPSILLPKLEKPQILHLTRKHSYVGVAWYIREFEIPETWTSKNIKLNLERVLWTSDCWVDGKYLGNSNSLVTPHCYIISNLDTGKHKLAIRIDNRKQYDITVKDMAHAYTNETQVMWNGIVGDLSLELTDKVSIENVKVFPDVDKKGVEVVVAVKNETGQPANGSITLEVLLNESKEQQVVKSFELSGKQGEFRYFYALGDAMKLWSEFSPNVYTLNVSLISGDLSDKAVTTFGMRKLTNNDGKLQINDTRIFLRGTLECCIFPLTGNPPMDKEGWYKVFNSAHQWGLNHLRFHSWCPPEAAFEVADEMGFYIQVELPLWSLTVGEDAATTAFIKSEAQHILETYGNHPSFCLWSMGNELEGNAELLSALVDTLKAQDLRHLYMNTTFSFQDGMGTVPQANDDFFVTQWTNNGWIRGQGVFNSETPSFNKNFSAPLKNIDVPVISHEIGQYSVYPNLKEIEKYTGSLIPLNFMAVKEDLKKKGMLDKANDFLHSSGKLAAILYKEEIERAMKTPELNGFQLLDLHDFPGQGTALVGLLDAFWESKGIISAETFREFCAPVVPLIDFPKAIYLNSETFEAKAGLANFSNKTITENNLVWTLSNIDGVEISNGTINTKMLNIGYNADLANISIPLQSIKQAQKLELKLELEGTACQNRWNIWVYPADLVINDGDIVVTPDLESAKKALNSGKKVLFSPNWKEVNGIEGKFVPVFWSPVHFPKQAGTMGLLCDPSIPALKDFPTDSYTDWQWWDLNINSTTVVLDSLSPVTPLVEMIDNFVSNRRLATVFEAKSGKGSLIFSSIDVISNLEKRPVAKQLLYSLLTYMNGNEFHPANDLKPEELNKLITSESKNNSKQKSEDIY